MVKSEGEKVLSFNQGENAAIYERPCGLHLIKDEGVAVVVFLAMKDALGGIIALGDDVDAGLHFQHAISVVEHGIDGMGCPPVFQR
ncbi:MAG: hypothetical protein Q9M45_02135 [Robiginitomaculum sp.]|nr:hypothetical protein [Robiginitomaculum sp.]